MEKANVRIFELHGTNREIGFQLGERIKDSSELVDLQTCINTPFTKQQITEMKALYDTYCPGLNEELEGFSEAIGIDSDQLVYNTMTYLQPGCSLLAVLPKLTQDHHMMIARNYEFSHKLDDFSFCKTKASGRYAHMGGSVAFFGRSEGMNEYGLAVAPTSCGLPVGAMFPMRPPAITGLQFWAVIRSLLENCKSVEEALLYLKDMPIAYNINLILADKEGNAVLFETLDGRKAYKKLDNTTQQQYIHSTNHAHLKEFIELEPMAMKHSVCRYQYIDEFMKDRQNINASDLKDLLLSKYPNGLYCNWYDDYFGTIKSMVFDVTLGTIELCWCGLQRNGWKTYSLTQEFPMEQCTVDIEPSHVGFEGDFIDLSKLI